MTTNLFSSYRQGENRVTATFVAVLQRLSLPNIDRILGRLLRDPHFGLVTFKDQPRGQASTPDARIGTGPTIWIETKTQESAGDCEQIRNHLESVNEGERLLWLTPDDNEPQCGEAFGSRVVWSNFSRLARVVADILEDEEAPPSEREAFLLREFISMLRRDGLLVTAADRVLVRAAGKWAWPVYTNFGVYTCIPCEQFRPASHMAFYAGNEIKELVPKIIDVPAIESIKVTDPAEVEKLEGEQRILIEKLLVELAKFDPYNLPSWYPEFSMAHKVVFLSAPNDTEQTISLKQAIRNDLKSQNDKRVAWMQGGSRYVTVESLQSAECTSQLLRA